ncbi:hypothetical protein BT63DRAFT_413321 [Microthyrium microscopicum]|uniref:Uncharacterized protein n=1 Tax=Microthyrium microscopicum TaxID=703497 RepID=A0A6A6UEA3_9PEZI|nr:hypothetical protein BT63DRAFT_413321 [Microthyrium microscopicum]
MILNASERFQVYLLPVIFLRCIKRAWQRFVADCKEVGWRRGVIWFLFHLWIWSLASLLAVASTLFNWTPPVSRCQIDNTWSFLNPDHPRLPYSGYYNVWKPSNPFEIVFSAGSLSFGVAKLIDVIWDVVVGRGGQTVLAFISYKVLTKYLTTEMATSAISIPTYRTIFLHREPSVWSTLMLIEDFIRHRALSSKPAMLWMITSLLFIISYPTLSSAMTSYSPQTSPYVQSYNGDYNQATSFHPILYVIRDGSRVNMTNDYAICLSPIYTYSDCSDANSDLSVVGSIVANYTKDHGFYRPANLTSVFNASKISSPVLNITTFYDRDTYMSITNAISQQFTSLRKLGWEQAFSNYSESMYTLGNVSEIYSGAYMQSNGNCVQNNSFKWGFSFILIFVFLCLMLIWTLGTFLLWLKAHLTLRLNKERVVCGETKAILQLADAIIRDLPTNDNIQHDMLTECQLNDYIRTRKRVGAIPEAIDLSWKEAKLSQEFRSLLKGSGKWWTLAYLLSVAAMITLPVYFKSISTGFYVPPLFLIGSGMIAAPLVGRSRSSRFLIVLLSLLSGGVFMLPGLFRLFLSPKWQATLKRFRAK